MYIRLKEENIDTCHICCGISDKKIKASYEAKKDWMKANFSEGYVFQRLDERAKVFIEYGPADKAWLPIEADNYLALGCFWVSGKYKGHGHGARLLQEAIDHAKAKGMAGCVAVVGKHKFHFMSDGKWLKKQGFKVVDQSDAGFDLLALSFDGDPKGLRFHPQAQAGVTEEAETFVVYYSPRCPFSSYHVEKSFVETAQARNLSYKIILLDKNTSKTCPSPATIFSIFHEGKFLTTDISICMDKRFDKTFLRAKEKQA